MNPNLELEEIISSTVFDWNYVADPDVLSSTLYQNIRDWMNRNQIIFYQP